MVRRRSPIGPFCGLGHLKLEGISALTSFPWLFFIHGSAGPLQYNCVIALLDDQHHPRSDLDPTGRYRIEPYGMFESLSLRQARRYGYSLPTGWCHPNGAEFGAFWRNLRTTEDPLRTVFVLCRPVFSVTTEPRDCGGVDPCLKKSMTYGALIVAAFEGCPLGRKEPGSNILVRQTYVRDANSAFG